MDMVREVYSDEKNIFEKEKGIDFSVNLLYNICREVADDGCISLGKRNNRPYVASVRAVISFLYHYDDCCLLEYRL